MNVATEIQDGMDAIKLFKSNVSVPILAGIVQGMARVVKEGELTLYEINAFYHMTVRQEDFAVDEDKLSTIDRMTLLHAFKGLYWALVEKAQTDYSVAGILPDDMKHPIFAGDDEFKDIFKKLQQVNLI